MDPAISLEQATLSLQASRQTGLEKLARATPAQAREAAEKFEGFFVTMVLESMFSGIETDSLFGGGSGEDVFRSLLLLEYGNTIAQRGDIG